MDLISSKVGDTISKLDQVTKLLNQTFDEIDISSDERQSITSTIWDRLKFNTLNESSPDKQLKSFLACSLEVYIDLHRRFNRGESGVCSGMKNGKNRPLIRKDDGAICAKDPKDGREMLPGDCLLTLLNDEIRPLTQYAHLMTEDFKRGGVMEPRFTYDERGRFLGCMSGEGKTIPPNKLQARYKARICEVCRSPSHNVCNKCRIVYYCSTKCQREDWSVHKTLCDHLKMVGV